MSRAEISQIPITTFIMNFLIKKAAIFTLLVFTLFACEEPGEIGLDIKNPGQSFGVLYTDTVTVQTSTVLVDSVRTSRTGFLMGGQYIDPQFGTIAAKSFFQISLRDSVLTLGNSPALDSVVLFLHESFSYGDTNQVQQMSVHLLQDSVRLQSYYSTDVIPYELNSVGSIALKSTPKKTDDTLKIKLDPSVGLRLIALNGNSIGSFLDSFFGLALQPETTNNAVVINFDASINNGSKLRLYYKEAASTSQRIYDFAINPNFAFNNIEAINKNGTPLVNVQTAYQPIPSSSTDQETFIEGGVGIMTKVDLSALLKLSMNKTIRFNQIFLVVQPVLSKTGVFTVPPSQLVLYRANSLGNPLKSSNGIYIPVENPISRQNPIVEYDAENRQYKIDITQYFQQLLTSADSENMNMGSTMFLSVPSFSLNSYYSTDNQPVNYVAVPSSLESSVSRLVLGSQQHPANSLKLQVYYTEIK